MLCTKNNPHLFDYLSRKKIQTLDGHIKLEGDNLICIAGRPGMGKTSLALYMALDYATKSSNAIHIFSLDMSAEQIVDRLLIMLSEIDSYTFRKGTFSNEEKERLESAKKKLSNFNFIINDSPFLTVQQIEERIESGDSLRLLIIDGVQHLMPKDKIAPRDCGYHEIGRQLKQLSNRKNIPIVVTSSLSRHVERRINKKPQISDLKKMGISVNDIDTICFVYREGYYKPFENSEKAEILIAKNKYGPCETIPMKWEGQYMRFTEEK